MLRGASGLGVKRYKGLGTGGRGPLGGNAGVNERCAENDRMEFKEEFHLKWVPSLIVRHFIAAAESGRMSLPRLFSFRRNGLVAGIGVHCVSPQIPPAVTRNACERASGMRPV